MYMEDERVQPVPQPLYNLYGDYGTQRYRYFGPLYVVDPNHVSNYPIMPGTSDNDLLPYGTQAIARVKPTSSVADLSVNLGELFKEGLPHLAGSSLWQSRLKEYSEAATRGADEYLNYTFGILPLIDGIKDTANAVSKSEKILRQYERDAGKVVRRRYEFPIVKETVPTQTRPITFPQLGSKVNGDYGIMNTDTVLAFAHPDHSNNFARPIYVDSSSEIKRWFSGAFSYYLPTSYYARDKWSRAAIDADKLLGIELTPEVLWNLTPWSWAADWFGNFGDVLANVSDYATDGLVLRYGYIMEERTMTTTYTMPDVRFRGYPPLNLTQTHVRVLKRRLPATPFGFGLTFDGFSTKQKAILAALGISKFG
jgi:hypothetical protein